MSTAELKNPFAPSSSSLIDKPLPSGPERRTRRRAQRERRAAAMSTATTTAGTDKRQRRAEKLNKRDRRMSGVVKGYRVIVSGMVPTITEAQVRNVFRTVGGNILRCKLGRQAGTSKLVGAAEVVFETQAQADRAVSVMNRATVDGRTIVVQNRGLAFYTEPSKKQRRKRSMKKIASGAAAEGDKKSKATPSVDELNAQLEQYMKM